MTIYHRFLLAFISLELEILQILTMNFKALLDKYIYIKCLKRRFARNFDTQTVLIL